jgi:hypothetical protein
MWRRWLRHCVSNPKVVGLILDGVIGIFLFTLSFLPHYDHGVYSASNKNEHQKYFLGGKEGKCVGLTTLPISGVDCFKIWELQPPGTFWACPIQWEYFTFYMLFKFGCKYHYNKTSIVTVM